MLHLTPSQFEEYMNSDPLVCSLLMAAGKVKILSLDEFVEESDKVGSVYVVSPTSSGPPMGDISEYRTVNCEECGQECWSHKTSYREWQSIGSKIKCIACCGGFEQIGKDIMQ